MAEKKKSKEKKGNNILRVKLSRELKSEDKVVYTNYGRFRKSSTGEVTLIIGDKKIKVTPA